MECNIEDSVDSMDSATHLRSMATRPQSSPLLRPILSRHTNHTETDEASTDNTLVELSTADDGNVRQRLLTYIVKAKRIFHCAEWRTWREFASPLHQDDSQAINARNQFVNEILPAIYDHITSDQMRKLVRVLDLHPNFTRTPRGYMLKRPEEQVAHMRQPVANEDYKLLQPGQVDEMMCGQEHEVCGEPRDSLGPHPGDAHLHTFVQPSDCFMPNAGDAFQFSPRTGALLSACLSKDYELAGCFSLEPSEMLRRLREAKKNFEDKAKLPENIHDAQKLQDKLKDLMLMKKSLLDFTTRSLLEKRDKGTK